MQEALKNPHYKKIWEKVIRKRHPEARTLKNALTREKAYFDCLFMYNEIQYNHFECEKQADIIGRPITLEDILLYYNLAYYEGGIVELYSTCGYYEYYDICTWQLTKPIHEQTPETWEKIAELINN